MNVMAQKMKDSEVLILRCPPPFYPQLASRSLLSVALLGCLPSLDAAVCVMRLHGLFFGTTVIAKFQSYLLQFLALKL